MTVAFDYFLISFQLKYLPGNININTSVSYLSEMLGYATSGWILGKVAIKWTLVSFFAIAGIGSFGALFYGDLDSDGANWTFSIFVMLMKFGMSAAFNIVYIAQPKMFPTLFAVTAMGIVNIIARVVTIFAPVVAEIKAPVPMISFTTLAILAGVGSLFLIEVKDKK